VSREIASKSPRASSSDLGYATLGDELDASVVATFVGTEEGGPFGSFVQSSLTAERDAIHDAVHELFDWFFSHAQGIAVARKRNHARLLPYEKMRPTRLGIGRRVRS
jgi:hypothetical protein